MTQTGIATRYNVARSVISELLAGRAGTVVCDGRGRAVLFASGEPSGLTGTMPGVLDQLRTVAGPDAPILLGFDRGGSYPVAFTACREAGMDWVTYRRGKLIPTTTAVTRSTTIREGRELSLDLADEAVDIPGYGQARQLMCVINYL